MTEDTVPDDDLRGMARRAGYTVVGYCLFHPDPMWPDGYYVEYRGHALARRALRNIGPFDNEADAWARACSLARLEGM